MITPPPFNPQPIEQLKRRYVERLGIVVSFETIPALEDLYDFQDGTRMIARTERFEGVKALHLSFSIATDDCEVEKKFATGEVDVPKFLDMCVRKFRLV